MSSRCAVSLLGLLALTVAPVYSIGSTTSSATSATTNSSSSECGDFPSKPLSYLIAFNAGGESDITARTQQNPLEKILGQSIHITYKPGGGGALAWSTVKNIKPDGYTLVGYNMPHIILQPLIRGSAAGYKTSDLKQVYMFQLTPYIITTGPKTGITSFKDLIERAKSKKVTIGGVGEGTGPNLVYLQLKEAMPDLHLTYVPYTGTGDLTPAIIGGHVDAGISNTPGVVTNPDNLHGLALAADEKMPQLPDVPTLKSLGVNIVEGAYRGVAVPQGTPECRVEILAQAIRKVNTNKAFAEKMSNDGYILVNYGPEKATKYIQERKEVYSKLLKKIGKL